MNLSKILVSRGILVLGFPSRVRFEVRLHFKRIACQTNRRRTRSESRSHKIPRLCELRPLSNAKAMVCQNDEPVLGKLQKTVGKRSLGRCVLSLTILSSYFVGGEIFRYLSWKLILATGSGFKGQFFRRVCFLDSCVSGDSE